MNRFVQIATTLLTISQANPLLARIPELTRNFVCSNLTQKYREARLAATVETVPTVPTTESGYSWSETYMEKATKVDKGMFSAPSQDGLRSSNAPHIVELSYRGIKRKAIFKPRFYKLEGIDMTMENALYKHEIAAYRLSKFLGLNVVPVTIETTINGVVGSLQLFVDNARPAGQAGEVFYPRDARIRILDYLTMNFDRKADSYLVNKSDPQVEYGIDNDKGFGIPEYFTEKIDARTNQSMEATITRFADPSILPGDRAIEVRLASLTEIDVHRLIGNWVSEPNTWVPLVLDRAQKLSAILRGHREATSR